MANKPEHMQREITAIKVYQWLKEWDEVKWDKKKHRAKPSPHFYIFTMPASELKALSGISRRTTATGEPRTLDLGIQRRHEADRSREIGEFIKHGYPWSGLSSIKRESGRFKDFWKPG